MQIHSINLCQDVLAGDSLVDAAAGRLDTRAEDDGEVAVRRGQGGDVVRQIVLVGARDGDTARNRSLRSTGVHHDNTVSGLGVDDGRDVEEVGSTVPVEGELGKDTGDVSLAIVVAVGVAGPALRELLGGVGVTGNGDLVDLSKPLGGGEDDVTSSRILVDKLGSVVGSNERSNGREKEGLGELHFEKDSDKSVLERSCGLKRKRPLSRRDLC